MNEFKIGPPPKRLSAWKRQHDCKCKDQPPKFWWGNLINEKPFPEQQMQIHAPLNFLLVPPDDAAPGDLQEINRHNKEARKHLRKQRWQNIKQRSAQFLAKVLFKGEVSFLGATRLVIVLKSKVIKFPRFWSLEVFLRGWLCNISERNNWHLLDKYFQNKLKDGRPAKIRFAPVLRSYFGGFFVVMQRAEKIETKQIEIILAEWEANGDWKMICDFCSDPNMNNFGMLNGEMVIIDYAQ